MKVFRKQGKPTSKNRLRAASHRTAKYAEEDYGSEEPNIRLSRAFVVVLLLHVVAVGGIFAFSALKDRQGGNSAGKPEKSEQTSAGTNSKSQPLVQPGSATTDKPGTKLEAQKIIDSSRQTVGSGTRSQNSRVLEPTGESGKTYVVQKGDSPAGIAKKFKVSYAELLKTNNIEDPKKLQIGQKLLIP